MVATFTSAHYGGYRQAHTLCTFLPFAVKSPTTGKLDGEILIRAHVKLRRGLFSPTGVRDLPVRLGQLSPARQTYDTFTTGQTGHLDDTWVLPSTANRALEFEWTGETHFHVEDMSVLPTSVLKRTHSQTQSDKPNYPPGLRPAGVSTGAQTS